MPAVLLPLLLCLTSVAAPEAAAGEHPSLEYEVKAAFLYNFAKFVTWPDGAFSASDDPLVLCIAGEDPFGERLDRTVEGRRVQGHPIIVRRGHDLKALGRCHVVFVAASEDERVARILHQIQRPGVLTVGESPHFGEAGGIIRLLVEHKRVRFEINEKAATQVHLTLSSQLLGLARRVER